MNVLTEDSIFKRNLSTCSIEVDEQILVRRFFISSSISLEKLVIIYNFTPSI